MDINYLGKKNDLLCVDFSGKMRLHMIIRQGNTQSLPFLKRGKIVDSRIDILRTDHQINMINSEY